MLRSLYKTARNCTRHNTKLLKRTVIDRLLLFITLIHPVSVRAAINLEGWLTMVGHHVYLLTCLQRLVLVEERFSSKQRLNR